jgi:hypothetical protein
MKAVAVTKGGLTIHNYTRYNTDDIVALAEALEDHNFEDGLVSYSEYAPNDAVTLRQAGAPLLVGTPMRGEKRRSFFKVNYPEGVNGGTITLANPNKLFELHLEQLAFEMDDEKVLPARFVLELAVAWNLLLPGMYRHQAVPRGIEKMRIRIEDKAAAKAPSARTEERKKKMRILNRLLFKLHTAMIGIDSVVKEAGEFMDPRFLEFVEEHKARLVYLRNQLNETRTNLRTPAHHQDKE